MMFVLSVKTTRKRLGAAALCAVLLLTVLAVSVFVPSPVARPAAVAAATEEQQLTFLRSLGYEADETPLSVQEIQLPDEADAAAEAYQKLQKQAGFDLSGYAGQRVKCWSWSVKNDALPDATAHLLIYEGKLIGGDVTPHDAGGMRPLTAWKQED